jgi:hypothetical protein
VGHTIIIIDNDGAEADASTSIETARGAWLRMDPQRELERPGKHTAHGF